MPARDTREIGALLEGEGGLEAGLMDAALSVDEDKTPGIIDGFIAVFTYVSTCFTSTKGDVKHLNGGRADDHRYDIDVAESCLEEGSEEVEDGLDKEEERERRKVTLHLSLTYTEVFNARQGQALPCSLSMENADRVEAALKPTMLLFLLFTEGILRAKHDPCINIL